MWIVISQIGVTKHFYTTMALVDFLKDNPGSLIWWESRPKS